MVEGPQFRDVHRLLEEQYTAVQLQADAFAERITTRGGVPVGNPSAMAKQSYVEEEPEGILDLRQMLSNDVVANQLGDYGSESMLKEILQAGEKHAAFLQKHLQPESLTRHIPVV